LRFNFVLDSFASWIEVYEGPDGVRFYTNPLGFVLLAGIAVSPLSGFATDLSMKYLMHKVRDEHKRNLRSVSVPIFVICTLSTLLSVCVLIPNVFASMAFFLLFRGFLFASLTSFIAFAFPSQHFGKLFGITEFVAGIVRFLQYALFQVTVRLDSRFVFVNSVLLCCGVLTFVNPIMIYRNSV